VHHVRRPPVPRDCPSHVTLRGRFRVVHDSVQRNHLHLLVESAGKDPLGRGMKAMDAPGDPG
jgi:hypothetical protein